MVKGELRVTKTYKKTIPVYHDVKNKEHVQELIQSVLCMSESRIKDMEDCIGESIGEEFKDPAKIITQTKLTSKTISPSSGIFRNLAHENYLMDLYKHEKQIIRLLIMCAEQIKHDMKERIPVITQKHPIVLNDDDDGEKIGGEAVWF